MALSIKNITGISELTINGGTLDSLRLRAVDIENLGGSDSCDGLGALRSGTPEDVEGRDFTRFTRGGLRVRTFGLSWLSLRSDRAPPALEGRLKRSRNMRKGPAWGDDGELGEGGVPFLVGVSSTVL